MTDEETRVLEIWEREDGWRIDVYSKDPLIVSRYPMTITNPDGTYTHFVEAATAHGYALVYDLTDKWDSEHFHEGRLWGRKEARAALVDTFSRLGENKTIPVHRVIEIIEDTE